MDLLLELARGQKVDLARISILALVEQYLAIIEGARRVRLELAADWLVMAAWLAWLKSRLLLPAGSDEADEGEEAAEVLADRLVALQAVRDLAAWLRSAGRSSASTSSPAARRRPCVEIDRSELAADLPGLLRAYTAARRRAAVKTPYTPHRPPLWTVQEALGLLGRMLGRVRTWTSLDQFLPRVPRHTVQHRAALASTLLAGLELARTGAADLRQDAQFGPILLKALL